MGFDEIWRKNSSTKMKDRGERSLGGGSFGINKFLDHGDTIKKKFIQLSDKILVRQFWGNICTVFQFISRIFTFSLSSCHYRIMILFSKSNFVSDQFLRCSTIESETLDDFTRFRYFIKDSFIFYHLILPVVSILTETSRIRNEN